MTFIRSVALGLLISGGLFGQGVVPDRNRISVTPNAGQLLGRMKLAFAPQMLTAIVAGKAGSGGPTSSPFITAQTVGTLRNNFPGCPGFQFTVGSSNIIVTDLGRWVPVTGTQASVHTIAIFLASTGAVQVSTTVNTTGAPAGAYVYSSVTPTTLTALNSYWIGSSEVNLGDQWYDFNTTVTPSSAGTVTNPAYSGDAACGAQTPTDGGTGANHAGVPPNFKYHL